jgi:hypothetical protein
MHVHPPAGVWLVRAAHALARETGSTERFLPDYQDRGFFIRSDEPCFARRDRPMQYYRIYVRLKSGTQRTPERETTPAGFFKKCDGHHILQFSPVRRSIWRLLNRSPSLPYCPASLHKRGFFLRKSMTQSQWTLAIFRR